MLDTIQLNNDVGYNTIKWELYILNNVYRDCDRKLLMKGPITKVIAKRINKELESTDQSRVKILSN